MKKTLKISTLLVALAAPLLAFAQTGINPNILGQYSSGIIGVVNNILVPVLMAIAFIVFLFGVYKYFILGAADEKSRTEGRQFSFWGIIGFIIILSLWGLVNLLMGTFGLQAGVPAPPPPTFGTSGYTPAGYTGGAGGGTGVSSATNAALLQQYNDMQSTCASSPTSAACTNAANAYGQAYYTAYPATGSGTNNYGSGAPAIIPSNTGTVTYCDTDNYTFATCQTNCANGGGSWNSTSNACTGANPNTGSGSGYTDTSCPSGYYYDYNIGCVANTSSSVSGCPDPYATNYNSSVTVDDGSCVYDYYGY